MISNSDITNPLTEQFTCIDLHEQKIGGKKVNKESKSTSEFAFQQANINGN